MLSSRTNGILANLTSGFAFRRFAGQYSLKKVYFYCGGIIEVIRIKDLLTLSFIEGLEIERPREKLKIVVE